MENKIVELEGNVPSHIAKALSRRGHEIRIPVNRGGFGRGQVILRQPQDVLIGGTEPRTDGAVVTW